MAAMADGSMSNGWTGGQYSLCRALLGLYLCPFFLLLVPGRMAAATAFWVAGGTLALFFAAGWHDRLAAIGLIGVCGFWVTSRPAIDAPATAILCWLLLAHLGLPAAPFGSWAARGRIDPAGGFRLPAAFFAASWTVLAAAYVLAAVWPPMNPWARGAAAPFLLVAFAPLALSRRLRPWLWSGMLSVQLVLLPWAPATELSLAMVFLHLFTFDPAWVRPLAAAPGEEIFYDGSCALCHASVRFLLAEDQAKRLRFAPLDGETFRARVAPQRRDELPDSLVIAFDDGRLLSRSTAVLHAMRRLGGAWRVLAGGLGLLPAALRDRLYDAVAATRYRLFGRTEQACPLLPTDLGRRFDP